MKKVLFKDIDGSEIKAATVWYEESPGDATPIDLIAIQYEPDNDDGAIDYWCAPVNVYLNIGNEESEVEQRVDAVNSWSGLTRWNAYTGEQENIEWDTDIGSRVVSHNGTHFVPSGTKCSWGDIIMTNSSSKLLVYDSYSRRPVSYFEYLPQGSMLYLGQLTDDIDLKRTGYGNIVVDTCGEAKLTFPTLTKVSPSFTVEQRHFTPMDRYDPSYGTWSITLTGRNTSLSALPKTAKVIFSIGAGDWHSSEDYFYLYDTDNSRTLTVADIETSPKLLFSCEIDYVGPGDFLGITVEAEVYPGQYLKVYSNGWHRAEFL